MRGPDEMAGADAADVVRHGWGVIIIPPYQHAAPAALALFRSERSNLPVVRLSRLLAPFPARWVRINLLPTNDSCQCWNLIN
jgi:hypothetical protein